MSRPCCGWRFSVALLLSASQKEPKKRQRLQKTENNRRRRPACCHFLPLQMRPFFLFCFTFYDANVFFFLDLFLRVKRRHSGPSRSEATGKGVYLGSEYASEASTILMIVAFFFSRVLCFKWQWFSLILSFFFFLRLPRSQRSWSTAALSLSYVTQRGRKYRTVLLRNPTTVF